MTNDAPSYLARFQKRELKDFDTRINELGNKSTQLLLFLSFAIVGAATLNSRELPVNSALVRCAMWWWVIAVFPVLLGVAPVKDLNWKNHRWYRLMARVKCWLLWAAVLLSIAGAFQFLRAVSG